MGYQLASMAMPNMGALGFKMSPLFLLPFENMIYTTLYIIRYYHSIKTKIMYGKYQFYSEPWLYTNKL